MFKKWSILLVLLSAFSVQSDACTIWASIGAVNKSKQLLFVKNRDAPLDSLQQLQFISPPSGYRYLALMYKAHPNENTFRYVSAGINQQGLNIADNDIHTAIDYGDAAGSDIMQDVLRHYASVAEVLQAQEHLFQHQAAQNLMIADHRQIIMVEIDAGGHYVINNVNGYLFHTNHYLAPAFIADNDPISTSTFQRYNRIGALLAKNIPFDQNMFEGFASDQSVLNADGTIDTNNNILRKWTVATWLIAIPSQGPPTLRLKAFNPNQVAYDKTYVLNQAFWQQKP